MATKTYTNERRHWHVRTHSPKTPALALCHER
jgi:hypothetical protein